jgi:hypothetical protein
MSERGISGQPGDSGGISCLAELSVWEKQEILTEIKITRRLARNAPFVHLGALKACQSVFLSVRMTKTRHSGCMFGRTTAPKRPKRD